MKSTMKTVFGNTKARILMMVTAFIAMSVSSASANETVTSSIATEFGSIQSMALAGLAAVATIAIVLFGGIYAWRYAKQVFKVISR